MIAVLLSMPTVCNFPLIAFGVLMCVSSLHYGLGPVYQMGPGWFPFWCSALLVTLSVCMSWLDRTRCGRITASGMRSIALISGIFIIAYSSIKLLGHG